MATWLFHQRIVAAYRDPDRAAAKTTLTAIVGELAAGVPAVLTELITLGRTLKRRAADVLAYFDRPGTVPDEPVTAVKSISASETHRCSASSKMALGY